MHGTNIISAKCLHHILRFFTSNCISRLFLSGCDEVGIEKMRSKFSQRSKSSGGAVTLPAVEAKGMTLTMV